MLPRQGFGKALVYARYVYGWYVLALHFLFPFASMFPEPVNVVAASQGFLSVKMLASSY